MCHRALILTVALGVGIAGRAQADDASPIAEDANAEAALGSEDRVARDWLIGFGLFAGNGLEEGSEVAAGMGLQFGRMLSPTLAWMIDGHGVAVGRSDIDELGVSSTILNEALISGALQWWPSRRMWLRAGVGPGRVSGITASIGPLPNAELEEAKGGFGGTVAAGYEIYRGRVFALDLHARYSGIRADGNGYSSIVAGLGLGWSPSPASRSAASTRQKPEPQPEQQPREGRDRWLLGVGFLAGRPINNDCSDCYWDAAAGADFQVGWMWTSRFALLLDTHAVAVGESDLQIAGTEDDAMVQGVVTVAAQYWTTPRLWIRAGVGQGEVRESASASGGPTGSFHIVERETGFGALAAVGYELYQSRSIGVNAHARYAGIYGDQLSRGGLVLGIGLAWYP